MIASHARGRLAATAAMVLAVALANRLAEHTINPWMSWGTPVIALTFLITEVTNQLLGPRVARDVVLRGFVVALALSLVVAPWRIACASATAFLLGQLTDIAVFARVRATARRGGLWWLSPFAASATASALDTAVFFVLAFAGTHLVWWRLALGDFAVKLAFDVAMLLPFRVILAQQRARQLQESL